MPYIPWNRILHHISIVLPEQRRSRSTTSTFAVRFCAVVLLVISATSSAADSAFVEVAVNGQTTEEEAAAYRVGLRIVLLRLTPPNQTLSPASIRSAEREAASFVQQRSFRVPGPDDRITRQTPLTPRVRETSQATHLLSIQYSRDSINQLILSQRDIDESEVEPVFTDPRSTLVWLIIQDGNQTVNVGGNQATNVMNRAREISGGIGQRLQFPDWNDTETSRLNAATLGSLSANDLLAVSRRYSDSMVVTGVLSRARGRTWNAEWRRLLGPTETRTVIESESLDRALQQGIRWFAEGGSPSIAGNSSLSISNADNEGLIWIGSVADTRAYAGLMQLLDNLEGATVYLKSMRRDAMLIAVSPRGAVNEVASVLLGSNRVVNAGSAPSIGRGRSADIALQYAR